MIKGASRVLSKKEHQSDFPEEVLYQLAADGTNEEHRHKRVLKEKTANQGSTENGVQQKATNPS